MTNNQLTDERLVKILSETQATIMEHNSRCVRGSVEVDARLFESMIMELQERRKAAMDSEPVILYRQVNPVNGMKTYWAELDPEEFRHLKQHTDENAEFMTLYRYAQPAPVVPDGLLSMAASAIEDLLEHTDPNTSYYSGVWADVPGKLRAAMIAAAPQDAAKKDKPRNNFGPGARLTNHRFKV
ncbi:TPA: hypothetical protein ACTYOT_006076 [Raoultella ornithinolytica]